MSRLTPFVKRHHYVSNFTSREINAQWFDCNRVCSLFIPRRIYTSPRILLSFFFVFCLVLFLTSFEEKKSAKRRFFLSLSRSFGSPFSLLFSSSQVQKKNRKVYLRFTRRLRRMRVAIKSEKRTRANNRALMHRHVGKVRRKEPKETLGEGVFRRFFLFFSFERGEERPWWGEKKTENFFGKRGKGKNKVEKRVLGRKRERTEGKKMWEGGSIDRSKKKQIWPDNWLNWAIWIGVII